MVAGVNLNYNTNASAMQMAQTMFGSGVTVHSATYTGAAASSAIYSGGDSISPDATPGDTGVIFSTGNASSFTTRSWFRSNSSTQTSTNTTGPDNDPWFNEIAGTNTYDASFIDVDFTPTGSTMTMQFVFGSEEYPEFSNSVYNDVVGVWINGVHVPLSITSEATQVGGVNQNENINLYNDNTNSQFNTEMDGFTVTMTLTIPVIAGEVNSIRIGIADVADSNYDSNVLIAADSIQTHLVAIQDYVTMQEGVTKVVDILGNDINNSVGYLTITHINGVAVTAGSTVTLATGETILVNADGTISITADNDHGTVNFTYGVASTDSSGNVLETDVGFVTVETIPCFVAGTMIETAEGPRRVETLEQGCMIRTRDDGFQPLRWIGRRKVAAVGRMAPIHIRANALGTHGELKVSPQHRILIRDVLAELMFGHAEVLVAAKDLVNDRSIRTVEGGEVEYVHLLFDRHQVIYSEGLETESFLPGPQTTQSFEAEIVEEICTIFPELDLATGQGYGPAARPMLRRYEAEALFRRVA